MEENIGGIGGIGIEENSPRFLSSAAFSSSGAAPSLCVALCVAMSAQRGSGDAREGASGSTGCDAGGRCGRHARRADWIGGALQVVGARASGLSGSAAAEPENGDISIILLQYFV